MLTLFGNIDSGNVHKIAMILVERGITYRRVDVSQVRGEPRRDQYRALVPMGKVPALLLDDGDCLSESGAILYLLAQGTALWPTEARAQAEVLRWMFFEQYSHEPALAVLRYLRCFAPEADRDPSRIAGLEERSCRALSVLEGRLGAAPWLASDMATIADFALYPYTKWANEAGIDLSSYPSTLSWLSRFESRPKLLALRSEGASEVLTFSEYFNGLHHHAENRPID